MWSYWLKIIRRTPAITWQTVHRTEALVGIALFVILLFSQVAGERAPQWLSANIWIAWLFLAGMFVHFVMRAVYEQYAELERENAELRTRCLRHEFSMAQPGLLSLKTLTTLHYVTPPSPIIGGDAGGRSQIGLSLVLENSSGNPIRYTMKKVRVTVEGTTHSDGPYPESLIPPHGTITFYTRKYPRQPELRDRSVPIHAEYSLEYDTIPAVCPRVSERSFDLTAPAPDAGDKIVPFTYSHQADYQAAQPPQTNPQTTTADPSHQRP